jgi:hypothetical protein
MSTQELPKSAAIERLRYDPSTRALTVWFRGSRRYDFCGVAEEVYKQLCGDDIECERVLGRIFPKLGRLSH